MEKLYFSRFFYIYLRFYLLVFSRKALTFRYYLLSKCLRLLFSAEFCCYLLCEGVELRDAEVSEPFEGHGPDDTGEDNDEEVADDSACVGIACAEGGEGVDEIASIPVGPNDRPRIAMRMKKVYIA